MVKNILVAATLALPIVGWADPIEPVYISNIPEMMQQLPEPVELNDTAEGVLTEEDGATRYLESHDGVSSRPPFPKLNSAAALVMDQEGGELLYAKNTDAVMPIASITKLMTAIVVLDSGLPLDEKVRIHSADVDLLKGTRSRLKVGLALTRRELLKLALMSSENRAAAALARSYPGGTGVFVNAMNRKALELGMENTHFLDSTGLNPGNVSTAHDLALMVNAGYQYALIRDFTTSDSHKISLAAKSRRYRTVAFHNSNGLVRSSGWEIGLSKTGYISEAGRCLVMQATIATKPIIIILLDSWGKLSRIADANRIKRWVETLETEGERPIVLSTKPRMG